ncbi:MAG: Holliday junction resolvase RecU [Solibacillus sp.]
MAIRYPNGKTFTAKSTEKQAARAPKTKDLSYSNRGKSLEDDLNDTNSFYLQQNLANIHKKPIPVQIVKVEYPSRSAAVIREAYFRTPSTTDYNGVWNGYYIDFEAKETTYKTSFPLQNIHEHQIRHLQSIERQKGIAFFIVRFSALSRDFFVPFHVVEQLWLKMEQGGRKSIPLQIFETEALELKVGYNPRLDYLSALQQLITDNSSL